MRTMLIFSTALIAVGQPPPVDQRIADLTDAIERKPAFGAAYYARGVTYLGLRQYANAEADLTKVIGFKPGDVNAYINRAEAFKGLSRHEEEITDLTKALELKPLNTQLHLRRANAYSLAGHCELAIVDYTEMIRAIPSVEAYRGRAACRKKLGDTSGATDDENGAKELAAGRIPRAAAPVAPLAPRPGSPSPADPPRGGTPYRIGNGVSAPTLIFKVEPEYSEEARKAKLQGSVMLSIVVDEYGEVQNISVLRALGLGLDQEAISAVRSWVFKPGLKDGAPVPVYAQISVTFNLL